MRALEKQRKVGVQVVVEQLWEMKKEQPSPVEGKDPCGVPVLVLGHSPVDLLVVVCGLELWE